MSNDATEPQVLAAAWEQFCDELKQAGGLVASQTAAADPLTQAEGYRYLSRLLRLSLEKHIEFADASLPQFYSLSHETAKIGNDNPDNLYLNCAIDGRHRYRIFGDRGTVPYVSIETKAGSFGASGNMEPTGHIELDSLAMDADGSFSLVVSAQPEPGNWLPMTPDSDNLLVRQTFHDRRTERAAVLHIECLDAVRPAPLQPQQFVAQLGRVAPFVQGTGALFANWMQGFNEHCNALPPNDQAMCLRAGGDPSIYYHNSAWRLADDEALLIEFAPPENCRSWNFQLSNYWMESLDYRFHRISLNGHTATVSADGRVRLLVAHHNPGPAWPNWLDTAGHGHGAMLLRYVEATDFPPVSTRVIAVADLGDIARELTTDG